MANYNYAKSRLLNLTQKLASYRCHILFLSTCLLYNFIPPSLSFSPPNLNLSHFEYKILHFANIKRLKAIKSSHYRTINKIKCEITHLYAQLPFPLQSFLSFYLKQRYHITFTQIKNKHIKKLSHFIPNFTPSNHNTDPDLFSNITHNSKILNLSLIDFTNKEKDILCLGNKFIYKTLPLYHILSHIEKFLHTSSFITDTDKIRKNVTHLLHSNTSISHANLSFSHLHAVKSLKLKAQQHNLTYTRADKGGKIVILAKDDYFNKLRSHFTNLDLFIPMRTNTNPTLYTYNKAKEVIKPLIDDGLLPHKLLYYLPTHNTCNMIEPYGLIKTHKRDFPIRIITPTCGSVISKLSFLLHSFLYSIDKNLPYRFRQKTDFKNRLKYIDSHSSFLCSVDIVSLYDNISLPAFLDILPNILTQYKQFLDPTHCFYNLSTTQIINITRVIFTSSIITFDNKYYKQKNGLPMGNPASPTIANIYLSYIEHQFLSTCNLEYYPLLYLRYLDDILIITRSKQSFDIFYQHILSHTTNTQISFTTEEESNNQLPYLDFLLSRNQKYSFYTTGVYRKPTHADSYIHPHSLVPQQYFKNIMITLRHRAYDICNTNETLKNEFYYLSHVFSNNGYNPKLISDIFHPAKCQLKESPKIQRLKFDFNSTVIIPFFGPLSYKIRRLLKNYDINTHFSSGLSFQRSLFKSTQKHTLPSFIPNTTIPNRKNVIYQINCNDCQAYYIGQTKRDFITRFKEHQSAINSNTNTTSLSQHCLTHKHTFKFTKYIDTSNDPFILPILESIHIYKKSGDSNLLNSQRDPKNFILPNIYKSLI